MARDSELIWQSSDIRSQDIRSLRPAKANMGGKAAKHEAAPVDWKMTCFCGQRWAESEAHEFMLHLRAEVGEDLAVLNRHRAGNREYLRRRRREDPEWAAKRDAQANARRDARRAEHVEQNRQLCRCGCGGFTKGWGVKPYMPGHELRERRRAGGS